MSKRKAPVDAVDWRSTLFQWSGPLTEVEGSLNWTGAWRPRNEDAKDPHTKRKSVDDSKESGSWEDVPNGFDCSCEFEGFTCGLSSLEALLGKRGTIRSRYRLDQGDGLGQQVFSDHSHDVCIGTCSDGNDWAPVAGCGTTEFGNFVTFGRVNVTSTASLSPLHTLTLTRRYVRSSDPRSKMLTKPELVLEECLKLSSAAEDGAAVDENVALPWRITPTNKKKN